MTAIPLCNWLTSDAVKRYHASRAEGNLLVSHGIQQPTPRSSRTSDRTMSWHARTCEDIDLAWIDGIPSCLRCNSSASHLIAETIEAPPPPAPPPAVKRSQLKCTWPPCVSYTGSRFGENQNDLTALSADVFASWTDEAEERRSDGGTLRDTESGVSAKFGYDVAPSDFFSKAAQMAGENTAPRSALGKKQMAKSQRSSLAGLSQRSIYADLSGTDGFRLLALHGANDFNDPILCSFEPRQLDDPLLSLYEAVSYTWADLEGDKRLCHPIFVGPQLDAVLVTKNCMSALRRYRNRHKRLLWIDAICINQNNPAERQFQVSLMGKIYSRASRVLIYLGEASESTEKAMAIIARQQSDTEEGKDCLRELSERAYFHRTWIIQEIALASKAIATCGGATVHWADLCSAFRSYSIELNWITHFSVPARHRHKFPNLFELLRDTRNSSCSDPRDKVFGVIGLVEDDEAKLLPVDYALSFQQLCTGLAAYWVHKSHDYRFLSVVNTRRNAVLGLPSWVPDWSCIPIRALNSGPLEISINMIDPFYSWYLKSLDIQSLNGWKCKDQNTKRDPIISDSGILILRAGFLFRYWQGCLSIPMGQKDVAVGNVNIKDPGSWLNEAKQLEIWVVPAWNWKVLLLERLIPDTFVFSLRTACCSLSLETFTEEPTDLHRMMCNIRAATSNLIYDWMIEIAVRKLFLVANMKETSGSLPDDALEFLQYKPNRRTLENIQIAIQKGSKSIDEGSFDKTFFGTMKQMRAHMLKSVNPEDLNMFLKTYQPMRKENGSISLFEKRFPLVDTNSVLNARVPSLQDNPQELMTSWTRSFTEWEKSLLQYGPFLDAFKYLHERGVDPMLIADRMGPAVIKSYPAALLKSTLNIRTDQPNVFEYKIHTASVVYGAYRLIETTSIDESLPWEWNRERFWICMLSFQLILRLRGLLQNWQIHSHVWNCAENVQQIVIV